MRTIKFTSALSGPFYAFPINEAPSFANWAGATPKKVQLTGSAGFFSGSVDTTTNGDVWLIFSGATQPASFDDWIAIADFSIASVQEVVDTIPAFGETQRWDSGENVIDVSVSRVT